jgi:hypothetical protein
VAARSAGGVREPLGSQAHRVTTTAQFATRERIDACDLRHSFDVECRNPSHLTRGHGL